jgi:hypothetical protein
MLKCFSLFYFDYENGTNFVVNNICLHKCVIYNPAAKKHQEIIPTHYSLGRGSSLCVIRDQFYVVGIIIT